jgi:hypothetical protein
MIDEPDKKTAKQEEMEALHTALARVLRERLGDDEVKAADLNVVRQFLKDNHVEADGRKNTDIKKLSDGLPEDIDDSSDFDNVSRLHS